MNSPAHSPTPFSPTLTRIFLAALAGAGGGLLSFFGGEIVAASSGMNEQSIDGLLELLLGSALWSGVVGLIIGAAILIFDNFQSLRGQWHRDVWRAVPLFFGLSFLGGVAGQLAYFVIQNSLTRGIGWSLMGAGTGIGIGILRRDSAQAGRGALGGALGGFIGGFIFDGLSQISSAGNGSFSRFVGQILMGALIALLMRVVQEALKDAWLLGVSTGPYEGKEYPLNTARVTVGREESSNIALFREREIPAQIGALVFQNGGWRWQGLPIIINGAAQSDAPLTPGDTLQFGSNHFRFKTRASQPTAPNFTAPTRAPASNFSPVSAPPVAKSAPFVPASPLPAFALLAPDGQLLPLPDLPLAVSVGRAADNRLVLADAGVSSHHARLQIVDGALSVTDLSSTNGTQINGAKISPHTPQKLSAGDRVRFGPLEYTVRAA